MPDTSKKTSSSFGALLFGALFCLGLPAFWTAVAPVSYLYLDRAGEEIQATAYTCMFFCIPYRVQRVDLVEGSDHRIHAGEWNDDRRRGGVDSRTKSEDEGFIVIKGGDQTIEVSCTPFNLKSREEAIENFMKDQTAQHLKLTCVSNWKFAVIAAVPLCLFTVLYVMGCTILFFRWLKSLAGFGEKKSDYATR